MGRVSNIDFLKKHLLGKEVMYDKMGQMIFGKPEEGSMQMILDLRGWGAISSRETDPRIASEIQDELGAFVVEAINQLLNKEEIKRVNPETDAC